MTTVNLDSRRAAAERKYLQSLFQMCIRDSFKYLGVADIGYNQPKSLPYPSENPFNQ